MSLPVSEAAGSLIRGPVQDRDLPSYEYRHVVTLDETSVTGNVYFTNYFSWQGHCRELFLRAHVPSIADQVGAELTFVTVRSACDFFAELLPFEEVVIRMRLGSLVAHRMTLRFSYSRLKHGREQVVAQGEQELGCMRRENGQLRPTPWPLPLVEALQPYGGDRPSWR